MSPPHLSKLRMACAAFTTSCVMAADPFPEILPIGQVQGEMDLTVEAKRFRSPLLKETVRVRGVIHQVLRWTRSNGGSAYAILIQNTRKDGDRNPATSDGLFLFTGSYPSLPKEGAGEYTARVGDRITVKGQVNERFGQTELSDAVVQEVEQGNFLQDLEVRLLERLPDRMWDRDWIFESLEGMRVKLPEGLVSVTGTHPNHRTGDLQLWLVLPEHPVAKRENTAARRLFRPTHPLSHLKDALVQEQGSHVVVGHLGMKEVVADPDQVRLPFVHAGSRIPAALTGGVHYSWGEYVIQPDQLPVIQDAGPVPSSLPETKSAPNALRIAAYNVENLYDFRNDPFDGCDFRGDKGCPDVRRPFNYVPVSEERYLQRLEAIAEQIVSQLDAPDVLLIQEVEDQDIGVMTVNGVIYGEKNDADGEVDALQELAIRIVAKGGPVYSIAIDRDGADERGITCAWMYNAESVRPVPADQMHPLLKASPVLPEDYRWLPLSGEPSNPKAFNAEVEGVDNDPAWTRVFSRPLQLMQLERISDGQDIYLFNNHFSSGPRRRVERRTLQATLNAVLARAILKDHPDAWVIVGGDLNVFPRPDDPLDPPSDQLGPLYETGLLNVFDRVVKQRPEEAYSYIYKGVVNTLDHMFISPAVQESLAYAGYLKLNAGAPESRSSEPPLRASDHDPVIIELR